jgi:hypothetical protein
VLDHVITVAGILLLAPLGERYLVRPHQRRRAVRHQAAGRLRCAMRVVEGDEAALRRFWWPYRAAVEPGMIGCRGRSLIVREVEEGYRETRFVEWFLINPDAEIIRVRTPTAVIEIALTAADRAWLPATVAAG